MPSNDTAAAAAQALATAQAEAEATVRSFYEPLLTGDTKPLDDVMAPDWAAVPPLRSGPGPEGWKASITHLRGVFTDLAIRIEDVIVSGDRVAVRAVNQGTHTGELLGVPGTGKRVEFRATDIHQLANGRIVRTWHLEDYFGIATQIGLTFTPIPPVPPVHPVHPAP